MKSPYRVAPALSAALVLGSALLLPATAQAAKAFLLPSAVVLNGPAWITVDAATSDELFHFTRSALPLTTLAVTAPDGTAVAPQNSSTTRFRSSFDLQLTIPGTYRIALTNDSVFANYEEDGKPKRFRGSLEELATKVPTGAAKLQVRQNQQRVETFVTAGKPSSVMKVSGTGLELLPVTHPTDLYAGETAKFRFTLDGQPAAGIDVAVMPGGNRYRDQPNETKYTADAQGEVSITWPQPGLYSLEAEANAVKASIPQAQTRNASYLGTFEVLPQ